jgi:hypothetical protein
VTLSSDARAHGEEGKPPSWALGPGAWDAAPGAMLDGTHRGPWPSRDSPGARRPNQRDADGRRRDRTVRAQGEPRIRHPSPFVGRLTRLNSTQETCHDRRRHRLAKAVRIQGAGRHCTAFTRRFQQGQPRTVAAVSRPWDGRLQQAPVQSEGRIRDRVRPAGRPRGRQGGAPARPSWSPRRGAA